MNKPIIPESDKRQAIRELRVILEKVYQKGDREIIDIINARDEVLARYQTIFNPQNLDYLTSEDFTSFLYFENNKHWTPLYRHKNFLVEDMGLLRNAITVLLDESRSIRDRLEQLRPTYGPAIIKGFGRALITPILLVIYPEKYGVMNGTSEAGMKELKVWPQFARGSSFGERYEIVNQILLELSSELGIDLWTLDALWWRVVKPETPLPGGVGPTDFEETQSIEPSSLQRFGLERYLHEFIFDNWENITFFSEWDFFEVDGEVMGYEYNTGEIGRIDLLAHHKTEAKWLVIELKRNQSSDTTIGQALRYMGWVSENLAKEGDDVQGLIICHSTDQRLAYALKYANNIDLLLYEVEFQLRKPN